MMRWMMMVDDGEWASVGAVMMAWLTLSHYSTS
jgi:hypothetical protein